MPITGVYVCILLCILYNLATEYMYKYIYTYIYIQGSLYIYSEVQSMFHVTLTINCYDSAERHRIAFCVLSEHFILSVILALLLSPVPMYHSG